jgi:hypothetical protein
MNVVFQEERSRRERVRKSRVDDLESMDVDHGEVSVPPHIGFYSENPERGLRAVGDSFPAADEV